MAYIRRVGEFRIYELQVSRLILARWLAGLSGVVAGTILTFFVLPEDTHRNCSTGLATHSSDPACFSGFMQLHAVSTLRDKSIRSYLQEFPSRSGGVDKDHSLLAS